MDFLVSGVITFRWKLFYLAQIGLQLDGIFSFLGFEFGLEWISIALFRLWSVCVEENYFLFHKLGYDSIDSLSSD